ncbi:MAG: hypothetical protein IKC09_05310 [Oscillospiraceae bacterium]|nr:hypothetical protein [Oscillospiraceae bacterium]MBR2889676.1 hypothetical protein [Oscillospiraceae bacterium]
MTELFLDVVNRSISASWLILAVVGLRLLLKKAPKSVNVMLWGLVALRLLFPFSVESTLSLIPSAQTIPLNIGTTAAPAIHSGFPALNSAINPILQQTAPALAGTPSSPIRITLELLSDLWLVGVVIMVLYTSFSYLILYRKLATAVILRDNLYQCEEVSSPFVLGLIHPRIYLPYSMEAESLSHVIAHEQAHILRRDHWWKPLGFLLLTIHWFNPILWLAYILLCRDIELACDEKVISRLGDEARADYSQALLECSINRRMIAACPLAFGEVGVKERVKNVMNYRKPGFWIMVIALIACIATAAAFLTNPPSPSLEVLPLIHSHSYGVVEVTYEATVYNYSMVAQVNTPLYSITEEMVLSSQKELAFGDPWTTLGQLKPVELNADNFDAYFYYEDGWIKGNSARSIRKDVANAWELIYNEEHLYYLLQMKNGELFLAYGYYDAAEKNDPGSDDTSIRWLYRLAVDLNEEYNITAKSGENSVPVTIFPPETAAANFAGAVHWLTIAPGEDFCPFRIYQNGQEVRGYYLCYDTKTYETVPHLVPSGLDPQTYLFQNCDPNKEYIVVMMPTTERDAPIYTFGVRFAGELQSAAEIDYYLTVGQEGVHKIVVSADHQEETMYKEDGTPYRKGDRLILNLLSGKNLLNGFAIEALDADGKLIWNYDLYTDRGITNETPIQDRDWVISPVVHMPQAAMIPTDSRNTGIFDQYLYLTIDGAKYRYERQEALPDGIQADQLLATVTEMDAGQYTYTVFGVKDSPGFSQFLVHSEFDDTLRLYRYSPSKACEPGALEKAKASGFVVMENNDVTSGQDVWMEFYEKTRQKQRCSVTLAYYHTLDPADCSETYYEAYREDYPFLGIAELSFDGHCYTYTETESGYVKTFRYLVRYTEQDQPESYTARTGPFVRYVLVNDESVTLMELWNGLYSSHFGDYIDHWCVYTDQK